jgi:hypothetical protein
MRLIAAILELLRAELVFGEHDSALEIFNHPFAHAAVRGLEFPTRRREPEMFRDAA